MKRPYSSRRYNSFTLVELLVVIGIISILAAVALSAGNTVLNSARRARAGVLANQVQVACMNYYSEYSLYPITPTPTADVYYSDSDKTDWQPLTWALCGNQNPYTPGTIQTTGLNSHNVAYLSLNRSDVDANGVVKNPLPPKASEPYFYIALDGDYSGITGDSGSASGKMPDFANSTSTTGLKTLAGTSGITPGVGVWANCNTSANTTNIGFYVRTF